MAGTVLAVATRAILLTVERMGLDADAIARRAGVDRRAIAEPDARLAEAAAIRVWQEAGAAAGDPALALRAAENVPAGAFRVLDYAAAASATLGEALGRIASYFGIITRARLELEVDDEGATLSFRMPGQESPPPGPSQEFTLAAVVLRTRASCGIDWSPSAVTFTFPAPADVAVHARVFGGAPRFGEKACSLRVAPGDLSRPSTRSDPELLSILDAHARDVVARLPPAGTRSADVARALERALGGGDPSIDAVARSLATTARTLQRHLEAEGTSFATILDRERERAARAHLARPDVAIAEISWLLGFSDQSAFTRAFRRWTGTTPARFRAGAHA